MWKLTFKKAILGIGLLFHGAAVSAADFVSGQELYASLGCAGCHGGKEGSQLDGYPSLVGADAKFIASELNKYRNGVRKDPTMSAMADGLTDNNIADLATFIANR